MASQLAVDKIACNTLIQMWDHDPGTTAATGVTPDGGTTERWVDIRDYTDFSVALMATIMGGNGPTLLEIIASEAEDDGDASVTIIKTSGTIAADAMGDWAFLECTAEEIAHLASTYALRYVTARITCENAGDEAVAVFMATAKRPHDAVTAATTIA